MKDYYDILGVPQNISKVELKRAYRILAQQYHPDKEGGNEKRFKELTEAYRILSGEESRANYDREYQECTANNQPKEKNEQSNTEPEQSKKVTSYPNPITIFILLLFSFLFISTFLEYTGNENKTTVTYSKPPVAPETKKNLNNSSETNTLPTDFPINEPGLQMSWYLDHDIPRYRHCIVIKNICTAEQWALAVYGDTTDPRGGELKRQADIILAEYKSQYPTKCVWENDVNICDLSNSIVRNYTNGERKVSIEGNAINCVNVMTGEQSQTQGDIAEVRAGSTFCVSDLGAVYIDPTINVTKLYGGISDLLKSSNYSIQNEHKTCIWTYYDGNGVFPYMMVSGKIGPSSGYTVRAFCTDFDNRVYIYSDKD